MGKERIGILGGTFDPIHLGHIEMALIAIKKLKLDYVMVIPCSKSPNKENVTEQENRWQMICAACVPYEKLVPSRIELDRQGISYTYDTLCQLTKEKPKAEFFIIIGADKLINLTKWKDFSKLCKLCQFAVFSKCWRYTQSEITSAYNELEKSGGRAALISDETPNISSTRVRTELASSLTTSLVPVAVLEYCQAYGMYSGKPRVPQFREWTNKLFSMLNADRFAHTLAVAYTARELAGFHNVDPEKAEIAGLLHDCAKCMPLSEQQKICTEYSLTRDEGIISAGRLLHGPVGSVLASTIFGVHDSEIIQAIAYHTTGKPQMSKLDMVVFLADKIEPTRKSYPELENVRSVSRISLEKAMLLSLDSTSAYVKKSGKQLHPASEETAQWLRSVINGGTNQ